MKKSLYIFLLFLVGFFPIKAQHLLDALDGSYYSQQGRFLSDYFTRQCPPGQQGSSVLYTTPLYTREAYSINSQREADQLALAAATAAAQQDLDANGQSYANTHGTCSSKPPTPTPPTPTPPTPTPPTPTPPTPTPPTPPTYTSTQFCERSQQFRRNDCNSQEIGTMVTYTVTRDATATSNISQEDADRKAKEAACEEAQREVEQGGQAYANQHGHCLIDETRGWIYIWSSPTQKIYTYSTLTGDCFNGNPGTTVQDIPHPGIWLYEARQIVVDGQVAWVGCNCDNSRWGNPPGMEPICNY